MQLSSRPRVKFLRPPVIEVACGVTFSFPEALKTAHIGAFWAKIKSDFPKIQDVQPLAVVTERSGFSTATTVNFEMTELPPLRRAWFVSADDGSLVQLQDDRFLVNWRRVAGNDPFKYPSYEVVIERFHTLWSQFQAFAAEVGLGQPTIRQLELVYVNAIASNEALPGGLENVLVDHIRSTAGPRFLPHPEVINWQSSYSLGEDLGRLHVVAQTAMKSGTNISNLRLDLTARGLPQDTGASGIAGWFDLAHEWITHGFADVTTPEAQRILWERQQ